MRMYRVRALKTIHTVESDQPDDGGRLSRMAVPGTASAVFRVTEDRLQQLRAMAAVVVLDEQDSDEPVPPAPVPQDDPIDPNVLPLDFPFRDKLVAAGLNTVEAVATFPDLTSVKGLGPARADSVRRALDELEAED